MDSIIQNQIELIKAKCDKIKPKLAIRCITYNHGPYIKDALDSFVMQKTDFPFVAIVHDDASTDNTAEIIKEYAEMFSNIIFPIYEKDNQYSKKDGCLGNIMNEACKATGAKYIAFCEGDDYWTDPYKLQKQVDFLESHPDISYTCHRFKIRNGKLPDLTLSPNSYLDTYPDATGFEFDFQYNFKNEWITKTLTSVFKIELNELNELRDCFFYRDVHRMYEILSKTNGYCFQFVGGVYRKQETGVWSQTDEVKGVLIGVKTWRSIYEKYPTRFNKWKYQNSFIKYVYLSIKKRKFIRLGNMKELFYLLLFP